MIPVARDLRVAHRGLDEGRRKSQVNSLAYFPIKHGRNGLAVHSDARADGRHCASGRGTVIFHFRISSCPQDAPGPAFLGRRLCGACSFQTSSVSVVGVPCRLYRSRVAARMTLDGHKTQGDQMMTEREATNMRRRDLLALIGTAAGGAVMYRAMSSMGFAAESTYTGPIKLEGDPNGASVL